MEISYDEIKKILPHRYPFLLVDKIIEIEPGAYAKGIKCVSGNEGFFQGHFPDRAIMPGVLQIEAAAQVGAIALLKGLEEDRKVLFGGIKNARFYRPVVPGDRLEMRCEIKGRRDTMGLGEAEIYVNGEKTMTCSISFAII